MRVPENLTSSTLEAPVIIGASSSPGPSTGFQVFILLILDINPSIADN